MTWGFPMLKNSAARKNAPGTKTRQALTAEDVADQLVGISRDTLAAMTEKEKELRLKKLNRYVSSLRRKHAKRP